MSTSKHIDVICLVGACLTLLLTMAFVCGETLGLQAADVEMGYESRLFDTSQVHTIDILMEDWDGFLETCQDKEYAQCSLVIDGETYGSAAIRAKGNNSLSSVSAYGNNRYSFKVEFDHYDSSKTYYGLDKLNLNNLIQDNTMMKDYLVYRLMGDFGVAAPLCSYVYLTVNGEDWGLYLAVEGVEEAFLRRNYGSSYGELYKPDSMNGGGGGRASNDDVKLQYVDNDPDSYSNIFNNAKTDVSQADQERLIASLKQLSQGADLEEILDTDAVLRYFVVHNFVCNFDSYTGSMVHNYYLYEEDGVLSMIPWDYNLAFGSFQEQMSATELVNFPIDTPVSSGDLESRPMVAWIFQDESYTRLYHQYFSQFLTDFVDSGVLEERIDATAALLDPYVQLDPTKFCTYGEFQTAADTLKEFCSLRAQSVSGQLAGTIPATSDGQAADSSALIDAAGLDLSDLGAFGGGAPENSGQGGDVARGDQEGPQGRRERGGETGSAPGNLTTSASISDRGVITTSLLAENNVPVQNVPGTGAQTAMEPPAEAQDATSADLPDQAQEETAPAPESEETVPEEAPASESENEGNDFTQEGGTPTSEDSTQTLQTEEPMQEGSNVTDGAQGQMTDSFGNRNQAGQGQPAEAQGTQPGSNPEEDSAVQAERETAILLAASLVCLLIGLTAVFLYPRKH